MELSLPSLELIHLPLVGYLLICVGLFSLTASNLLKRNPRPSSIFFSLMAAQSLLVTWRWMLRYFAWSWEAAGELHSPRWALRTALTASELASEQHRARVAESRPAQSPRLALLLSCAPANSADPSHPHSCSRRQGRFVLSGVAPPHLAVRGGLVPSLQDYRSVVDYRATLPVDCRTSYPLLRH